jgi:hypothetical protein
MLTVLGDPRESRELRLVASRIHRVSASGHVRRTDLFSTKTRSSPLEDDVMFIDFSFS